MGVVHVAYHEDLDRKVALKLLHRDGDAGRALVRREAQALARLSHPNVVQIYEVGEHEGRLFVAMEYVDGEPLDVWQRRPGRRLGELLGAYRQAAAGLAAAHAAGLVHRDFKPANAIVGADGRVRVLDFGLARARTPARDELRAATGPLDQTVGVAGTPAYMSPEQFAGLELDARSDVFSFSVALWEAVHGARPFAGATYDELAANVTAGARVPPPPGVDLPGRLRHALDRGLEPRRDARWSSLDALRDALAADPDADPTAATRERRLLFVTLGGLVLLVFVPLLALGVLDRLDRLVVHLLIVASGLLVLTIVSLVLRRALLRNAYHRRMILFIGVVLLALLSQRATALCFGAPVRHALFADLHVLLAACLVGAIFFARWMLVLAAIIVASALAALLLPGLFPAGSVVIGPLFVFTFGHYWRREAQRVAG